MNNIEITQKGQMQITNSKNVADVFGKTHRDVTRDIKNLDCSDKFRARNFAQSYYISQQNKNLSCIEMTKDGFTFLCMGYRGKKAAQFKEAYIDEFNRMSDTLNSISARINKLEMEGREIKELGKEWSSLGREINQSKKEHIKATNELMNEVQLKLDV